MIDIRATGWYSLRQVTFFFLGWNDHKIMNDGDFPGADGDSRLVYWEVDDISEDCGGFIISEPIDGLHLDYFPRIYPYNNIPDLPYLLKYGTEPAKN